MNKCNIIGTCGHEIEWKWFDSEKGNIAIKDVDSEGQQCVSYLVVCPKCLKWYKKEGLIIEDKIHRRIT